VAPSRARSVTIASLFALAAACGDPGGSAAPDTAGGADALGGEVSDGHLSDSCSPGDVVCVSPTERALCDSTGTQWVTAVCPEDHGCDGGQCRLKVCPPLATAGVCASPTSHERCQESGTGWELHECPAGTTCRHGLCAGQICIPGSRICGGFVIVNECDEGGDSWSEVERCGPGSVCDQGVCLSPCEVNIKDGSYLGCEYWALDLDNVEEAADRAVGIVVSVPGDSVMTEVRITHFATGNLLGAGALGVSDLFVAPGQTKIFTLPEGHDISGSGIFAESFRIRTTTPVTIHQFNPINGQGVYSNDASLLLPSQVIGSTYFVMSWPHRSDNVATLRGFATVVATHPGTTSVQVIPSANVVAGPGVPRIPRGQLRIIELSEGQVLSLQTEGGDSGDLTGTLIEANQPIAVFGGHECANVPVGISACDHLESQLFPAEAWGSRYVADTFHPRSATQLDVWRVMAGDNGVNVRTNPPVPGYEEFQLQLGTWLQFPASEPFEIIADGPIQVGHYMTGSGYPGANKVCEGFGVPTGLGDPAFTLAVPTTRYLRSYTVLTPTGYTEDYLNIVARMNATITLNGEPLRSPLMPIGDSGWGLAREAVSPGVHKVEGSSAFGLTAYGYDCDVSYAYPGGLNLQRTQEF